MQKAPTSVSRDQIITYMREMGLEVTPHQLVRWHKRGLLPRPRRRSLGRGRGMESRYPAIALAQTYAILLMRDLFPRDLDSIGWCLWCFGFPITPFVRASLTEELQRWETRLRRGFEAYLRDEPDNPIERLGLGRVPDGFRLARRRVGKVGLERAGRLMYEVLLDEFGKKHWTYVESEYEAWAQAVEAQVEAEGQSMAGAERVRQVPEALDLLSRELNLPAIRNALQTSPDAELCRARDEIQTLYRQAIQEVLQTLPAPDIRRLRDEIRKVHRHSGLIVRLEESLVPKPVFLLWFAFRYVSPSLGTPLAETEGQRVGPGLPLLARIACQQALAKSEHGGHTRTRRGVEDEDTVSESCKGRKRRG